MCAKPGYVIIVEGVFEPTTLLARNYFLHNELSFALYSQSRFSSSTVNKDVDPLVYRTWLVVIPSDLAGSLEFLSLHFSQLVQS